MPAFALARCSPRLRFLFEQPENPVQRAPLPATHVVLLGSCPCGTAESDLLGSSTAPVSGLLSTGAIRTDQKNGRLPVRRVLSDPGESRRSVGKSQHECRQLQAYR